MRYDKIIIPNCINTVSRRCVNCGKRGTKYNPVGFQVDPYEEDINNNPTLYWLCSSCVYVSAQNI